MQALIGWANGEMDFNRDVLVRALQGQAVQPDPGSVRRVIIGLNKEPEQKAGNGPMREIQVIRHGATQLNNDDVSVDRVRGWKDIPLSTDGKAEAQKLAKKIADDPPDAILTSDLKRAHDTAKIVSDHIGVPIVDVTQAFRPWNVGNMAGKTSKEAIPVLADYAENKPDEPIPGGESFNTFKQRFLGGLGDALSNYPGRLAIVTHHRGERLLHAWRSAGYQPNGDVDIKEFNKKGEHTASADNMQVPVKALEQSQK